MPLEAKLRRFCLGAGLLTTFLGLVGLAVPASSHFGLELDGPGAAIAVVLSGTALIASQFPRRQGVRLLSAAAALLLGAGILVTGLLEVTVAGDFLAGGAINGLLIVTTALALLLLRPGSAARHGPTSAWLGLVVVAGAAGTLLAIVAGPDQIQSPTNLSGPLVAALLVLGLGAALARPDNRYLHVMFAPHGAGILARRLFLAAVILPVCFGAAFAWMVGTHHLPVAEAGLLFVATTLLSGFIITLFSAEIAAGLSERREEAESQRAQLTARLQQQAAELQETVSQRTRELREANASLRASAESNALLALVAQNTTNGVVITDAVGGIAWVNVAFTRITGHELEAIKGRRLSTLLTGPETDPAPVQRLQAAERDGVPAHETLLNYTRTGQTAWHAIELQPVHERSGRLINFVINLTDITAERADKIQLEHLSQRLKMAARAAELGIWEWDVRTQRSLWDARMCEIYGQPDQELVGGVTDWLKFVHADDRDRVTRTIDALMKGGSSLQQEYRIVRPDGIVRQVLRSAVAERDEQGRLLRIIGTDRDITVERESTQQLQSLNERLQLALRSSKYGVWEHDLVHQRRIWDERQLEIYGLRPDQFDGSEAAWLKTLHPDDQPAVTAQQQQVIAGTTSDYDLKFRIVRPDGSVRHVESHGHVQRNADGRAIRLVGLSRDITENAQLEQALELAEQRWQLAIEGTNDSVWDWDVTSGHVYHDERWTRIMGYEPGEIDYTIDGWKRLAHPDDLPPNEAALQEHFAQRTSFYCHELRMRAKDGTWRWILDRGKVVRRAPDGRPLRMVGTHSDVTARRVLEDRLRTTEQLATEVSRIAQIGGFEINLTDGTAVWNEGMRRICEVDDAYEPSLERLWSFIPPEALPTVQASLHEVKPDHPSFDVEVPLNTGRGNRIWVRILGHASFAMGRATSVRGALQDITARHESESSRRELEAQLFQAQKMETLGTLAGGIAHDFNNLLTGIIGYHELAADSLPSDHPARECLAEARNASLRARELVEQILTFGRHSGSAEHMPLDLVTVIDEARRFLRATVPANISIEFDCAPNCGSVMGDTTQLHQVILNLGSNAAHAMRQNGGTLKISLKPAVLTPELALTLGGPAASEYVCLTVSDTGHGMDESTRRRIFDPFFTTKNTREGTGLGLAVVHGIVRSHRGAIDVESVPGRGSSFCIYLPVVETGNKAEAEDSDTAPRGGGEFVCVVDDEEVVGSCTKLVLESQGYQSLIFASAEACLAHLQANPTICSVLVTDQTMPGMQGTELAAAVRRLRPNIPVVIMSGYFSKISPQALDELGQVELLAKPFTTDELATAVYRALHPTS